jgi:hypothetical protein
METVSKQEYDRILSELDLLTTKFVALEQENQKLLGDLQQVSVEKAQQHEELSKRVQQLELVVLSLRQQGSTSHSSIKEPKISLPTMFDGTRSQFRGFLLACTTWFKISLRSTLSASCLRYSLG